MRKLIIKLTSLSLILFSLFFFSDAAEADKGICPNSSVKCKVTFTHPKYGEVTVDSEKGKNDSAIPEKE